MILGLLILFAFLFVIMLTSKTVKTDLQREHELILSKAFQKEALRIYMDDCLHDELEKGLILLGRQGRIWSDQPGGRKEFMEGRTGTLLAPLEKLDDYSTGRVAYGITAEEYPAFSNAYPCNDDLHPPAFCTYKYPNTTVGFGTLALRTSTIEDDLQRFLASRMLSCVDEFLHINVASQAQLVRTDVDLKLDIHPDGISVKAEYPLTFRIGGEEFFHLTTFDFFYHTEFKKLLDTAVAFPLQWDQKFVDFRYDKEQLLQPLFSYGSEEGSPPGSPPLCRSTNGYYLCDRSLSSDVYQSLDLQWEKFSLPATGDDIFSFTAPVGKVLQLEPYTFRVARQNRPPALDYISRYPCPDAEYDYLVVKNHQDSAGHLDELGTIDITAKAIDADEDTIVKYEFERQGHPETIRGADNYNNFHSRSDQVYNLHENRYELIVKANDEHHAVDQQTVRILVDRPMTTEVSLHFPDEYEHPPPEYHSEGLHSSLGGTAYVVSNEDPVFMDITIPGLTAAVTAAEDIIFTYNDEPIFTLPNRNLIQDVGHFCYNLPLREEVKAVCALSEYTDEANIQNIKNNPDFAFPLPFRAVTADDRPDRLKLSYTINYCGNFPQQQTKEIDVHVKECLPHQNPEHPYPYMPGELSQFYKYKFGPNPDGTTNWDDPQDSEEISPFETSHNCCNSDYEVLGPDDPPCFVNREPGCYDELKVNNQPFTSLTSNNGYIWEIQRRLCDGTRGNICSGEPDNKLFNDILWCGQKGQDGCTNVEQKCNNKPAFSYIDANGDGRNDGWCDGKFGCAHFCETEVVYTGNMANLQSPEQWNAIATTLIMRDGILEIEGRPQFPYKCGCGNNDNGKPCDKFRGNFLGECLNGICDVRVCDAGESGCSSDS